MARRYFQSVVAVMLTLAAVGCSKSEQNVVEGTVTYQGKPVSDGQVVLFCPELGCGGSGSLDAQGAFRIEGALKAGTYRVTVQPPPPPPPLSPEGKQRSKDAHKDFPVPSKYRSDQTTDLRVEVGPGSKRVESALK